jgi:hypothetical protein
MAIGIAVAIFLSRSGHNAARSPSELAKESPSSAPSPTNSTPQGASAPIKSQLPGGPYEPADPRWTDWNLKRKADPKWEWKSSVNFYGKVVDQDGMPVPGANIRFDWTDLSPQGTSIKETASDDAGLFSLVGQHGKFLEVNVSKDGYYTGREGNRFDFEYADFADENYYEPDPNAPVVFHLRKKGEPAQLIHRRTLYGITVDGKPHYFDLVAGKKQVGGSPTGDLVVQLNRSAVSPQNEYTWSASVEAVNGGVLQSSDESMLEAPEGGYQQSLQVSGDRNNQPDLNFFFTSRNGQIYGRMTVRFEPNYTMGPAINMDYYVNPSGSRNLESATN